MGWSTQFSIFSPNMYTRVFRARRLSMYSCGVFNAISNFLLSFLLYEMGMHKCRMGFVLLSEYHIGGGLNRENVFKK